MKLLCCLTILLAGTGGAHAQAGDPDKRGAYLSFQYGNGRIYGGNSSGDTSMAWRSGELRVGRDLDQALAGADATARIDFLYYNEGHPFNNHRDGFALQATYTRQLSGRFAAELSAGPYSNYNTTTIDGVQINDAAAGVLFTGALRYALDRWAPGAHVRLAFNHVWMRDKHRSNAVMLGIGRHFAEVPPFPNTDVLRGRRWFAVSYGVSQTTQAGRQVGRSGTLEAKQYGGKWALSAKAVFEGDDQVLVDRRGVAAQAWFVQPITDDWQVSAGVGPYLAQNRRTDHSTGVHGLVTMQFERNMGERTKAFFAFSRVKSFQEANDRDIFHFGATHAFGS
ncbi:MAG: hypothetical protein V4693_00395 [Pseudomonadota bacterium]